MTEKVAVVGLGYVGLPVALAFARKFPGTVGFDINVEKVNELRSGFDRTGEIGKAELTSAGLEMTADPEALKRCTFFVVAVPTPVDSTNRPDLTPVFKASETVGRALKKGDVVVYESTVYPGVTEELCGPILAKISGLKREDFKLGYSPERINPGDKLHTLEKITKVVSGEDAATLDRVASTYGAIIDAGVFRATSIKVAEAAKVIENTQRDLNIALMNELALIFDRMDIRTRDVLAAAGTKWNFLKFTPGLVGGHCIGVDPYYLTHKADMLGYHPQVILAGRRINDSMGKYVAEQTVKRMIASGQAVKDANIVVLGMTFKEDCPDLRNSKVIDVIQELQSYGVKVHVHDPIADSDECLHEYGIGLTAWDRLPQAAAVIAAVAHQPYKDMGLPALLSKLQPGGVFSDVKSAYDPEAVREAGYTLWRL